MINPTANDFASGEMTIPIEYRCGPAPAGCPERITVRGHPARFLTPDLTRLLSGDNVAFFQPCLHPDHRATAFLDRLTPDSLEAITDAAICMTFGVDWQKKSAAMIGKLLQTMGSISGGLLPSSPPQDSPTATSTTGPSPASSSGPESSASATASETKP